MRKILGASCFTPITLFFYAWLIARLNDPDAARWAILPLTTLTLIGLALRLKSTDLCVAGLAVQIFLSLFFMGFHRGDTSRKYGWLTSCKSNLKNLSVALEQYREDRGEYPASLENLVPGYLKAVPQCRSARRDTYSSSYFRRGEHFRLFCSGENHLKANTPAGYPQFTSVEGLIER